MYAASNMDRRGILAAAVASLAAACTTSPGRLAQQGSGAPSTADFLLIHGAWHGGWCWNEVRTLLEAGGHRVHTPTLAGLAERKDELGPDIGLVTHVAETVAAIDRIGSGNIVLVGHSYGGMPITGALDRRMDRIAHAVYLDAVVPEDGQSMITQGKPRSPEEVQAGIAALEKGAIGGLAIPVPPPEGFGIASDSPLRKWVADRLTPHPVKTWLNPIALKNGPADSVRRTYIYCNSPALANGSFGWYADEFAPDPKWSVRTLATGHDAMITAPRALADLLLETV